jgi:hypothetical protein
MGAIHCTRYQTIFRYLEFRLNCFYHVLRRNPLKCERGGSECADMLTSMHARLSIVPSSKPHHKENIVRIRSDITYAILKNSAQCVSLLL